ncbi:unnamed protein product [Arctogadus glacialis]
MCTDRRIHTRPQPSKCSDCGIAFRIEEPADSPRVTCRSRFETSLEKFNHCCPKGVAHPPPTSLEKFRDQCSRWDQSHNHGENTAEIASQVREAWQHTCQHASWVASSRVAPVAWVSLGLTGLSIISRMTETNPNLCQPSAGQ